MEEGQIPREALGNSQRRIETARAYYLAEHQDEPVGKIQNVAVTTLEKFRSGVRRRRNLAPRSLPENDVRFIDPQYNELFRVPDGGVVQMTYPDGHQRSEKVEYLDDYHMKIGSTVQHICEFAERMARSRGIVEPEPLTQQDCRAWNLEYDYYLTVQAADNGSWEYALYQGDCCLLERGKIDAPELRIEEVRDEILYSHNLRNKDCIPLTQEEFTQKLADRNEIQSYRMKQFQQSGHDCYLVMQLQQDADPALRFAAMRYLNKQNVAPSMQKGANMNTNSRNVTYLTVGDYQLPNLILNQPRKPLGKYGRLRRTYLKEQRPVLYHTMLLSGSLYPHLMEVEQTAESRMQQMMAELLKQNPAPDKAQNQLMWVQHINSLKAQAEEMILTELIYS